MTKKEATRYLYKFYRVLRNDEIRLRLVKGLRSPNIKKPIAGMWDPKDGPEYHISLNPDKQRKGGIVQTLIHELLHHIDYDLTEKEIKPLEREIFKALSNRQLTNLVREAFHWCAKG